MVFEKVIKGGHFHSNIQEKQISISKHTLVFGKEIAKEIGKFVEIYLDRKNKLVGFAKGKNAITGYKVHKGNNATGIFARELDRGLYDAKFEKGLWVIKVSKIPDAIPTINQNE